MYTLRIVVKSITSKNKKFDKVVDNYSLGNSYRIAERGMSLEFQEAIEKVEGTESKNIKAVVFSQNQESWFIMEDSSTVQYEHYIVTESGKTFDRL